MLICQNFNSQRREEIIAKRIERDSSLALLKKGQTVSFFSASKRGYQQEFAKKDGIVLLEVHIMPNVPYIDFEKVLGVEYQSIEEQEILLSPFVSVIVQEKTLLPVKQRKIQDIKKEIPRGKYRINMVKFPNFIEKLDE